MDIVDKAQVIREQELERALNENRAHFVGEDVDFLHCLECGVEIPSERRAAIHRCKLCVDCQTSQEAQAKHYRKP
ncbi:TraR/DksA C4-type zinc finger protein [Pseudoalteromonas rubra]|uniref:TraR/DksA C4-type zinc finger protein n=1 Tax=Pseudoalteromonas rubra TaxID=43658 RepID=UPI0006960CFF|nr:TraR/DksA C4-type zinc finger protein [Pseudoalteromonas rubra]